MADEQHRWLDRGTAERLLSGEPPEAADPGTRDQAERLARTLRALSAPPPSVDGELPGEAAALAAFRAVREGRAGAGRPDGTESPGDGLVRIGTPRDDRSGTPGGPRPPRALRLGLAASLVAGMVGGAAVLGGAGVLPSPSGDTGADPAASANATHPERPLLSPPPETDGAAPGGRQPDGESGRGDAGAPARSGGDTGAGGPDTSGEPGPDSGDPAARHGHGGKRIDSACRAWRDGKSLNGERERLLEDEAGGPARVGPYCEDLLSAGRDGAESSLRQGKGSEKDPDKSGHEHKDKDKGKDESKDKDKGKDKSKGNSDKKDKGDRKGQGADHGRASGNAPGNAPGKSP